MIQRLVPQLLALGGGILLGVMIFLNGELARHTTAQTSSTVAHGIGALAAWLIWAAFFRKEPVLFPRERRVPWVLYLGGIPGAFTVILASYTVNSQIGFAGTISLMILGQVAFGMLVDVFGWFSMPKREMSPIDFLQLLSIMSGTAVLIFLAKG